MPGLEGQRVDAFLCSGRCKHSLLVVGSRIGAVTSAFNIAIREEYFKCFPLEGTTNVDSELLSSGR